MNAVNEWLADGRGMLREALPGARDVPAESSEGQRGEIRLRIDGALLVVEMLAIRAPRIAEVEGLLARSVLRMQRLPGSPDAIPVIVVALGRYGPKLESAVRDFMAEYAPDCGWGLLDRDDKAVLVVPPLGLRWHRARSRPGPPSPLLERRDRTLFTDLNRWMLKILLLRNAPEGHWGGPRQHPRHPTDLAGIAGVSVSKAHQFASTFKREGLLRRADEGLRLVRTPALLEAWLQDERNSPPEKLPVRSFVPARATPMPDEGSRAEPSLPLEAWSGSAIGGMFAAEQAGLLRASGRSRPLVHVGMPLARALHDWRLESCDLRDARMILVRPLHPASVFRGSVPLETGARRVDIWQIALDAVSNAARGQEQAEYILERVLALQENA